MKFTFPKCLPLCLTIAAGEHTLAIKITTGTGGIAKFAEKRRTCPGCKVPLAPDGKKKKIGRLFS